MDARGARPVTPYTQRIPIRFADIDVLDHVNHAVILTYCETVRCDWFEVVAGYASMQALPFIIASAHVEYKAPIPKSAKLEIVLTCPKLGTKSWDFDYELRDGPTGKLFATARTVQVAFDYRLAATIAIPPALRALLEALSPPKRV